MQLIRKTMVPLCLLALVGSLAACSGGGKVDKREAEKQAKWESLQQEKAALDQKRTQLAELEAASPAEGEAEGETEGETGAKAAASTETAEADKAQAGQLRKEVMKEEDEFRTKLVDFINSDPPLRGEPMTERQQAAIRMKSSEDMRIAHEYIAKGGDYPQAISIYQAALAADPDNTELQQALADAEAMRYMSEDRFAKIKKGMTENEVREALGPPNVRNVRDYDEKGVTAWFYPKDNQGAAAAVWFRKNRKGEKIVYKADFKAAAGHEEEAKKASS